MSNINTPTYQNLVVLAPHSLDSLLPLEIMDDSSAMRAAFVEKYGIWNLPENWKDACGFYVLFSPLRDDNSFEAYVGKATNGFYRRLKTHHEEKAWWRTAILFYRDTSSGFTSTQSSYLEGRMRDILDSSPHVTVHNIAATGDRALPEWEKPAMEAVILSALRIMFLRGYRNASMGLIADNITAGTIDGFKPSRTAQETDGLTRTVQPPVADQPIANSGISVTATERSLMVFPALREWRLGVARESGLAAYLVFSDKELHAIAAANPENIEQLLKVSGVGPAKAEKYGQGILDVLAGFRITQAESPRVNPSDAPNVQPEPKPSKGLFGWM